MLSNSDWCTNIWENAFWDEPVKRQALLGVMFCLMKETKKSGNQKKYNLSSDTKIVMCAPTFRGGSQSKERKVFADIGTIEFSRLRHALEEKFGGIWVVFVRLHPQLALKGISYNNTEDGVIDVTTIDDMYELLAATDAFVSDYSSAAFDASYMKIPVFLYVDDLDDYVADRGKLTWNIAEIPFLWQRTMTNWKIIY